MPASPSAMAVDDIFSQDPIRRRAACSRWGMNGIPPIFHIIDRPRHASISISLAARARAHMILPGAQTNSPDPAAPVRRSPPGTSKRPRRAQQPHRAACKSTPSLCPLTVQVSRPADLAAPGMQTSSHRGVQVSRPATGWRCRFRLSVAEPLPRRQFQPGASRGTARRPQ